MDPEWTGGGLSQMFLLRRRRNCRCRTQVDVGQPYCHPDNALMKFKLLQCSFSFFK